MMTRNRSIPSFFHFVLRAQMFWVAVLCLMLTPELVSAQEFDARVDRRSMALNETLTLDVVYAERADTSAIDFEAALPDFSILSLRPSSQTRYINLQRTSQTTWQLSLMPKRVGRLRIPSFQIGSVRTQPIDILVSPAPDGPEAGAPFSAELVIDRERSFIGGQILVRILLTTARGIGDLRGSPLEVPDADAILVNQSEFQRVIGDAPYQVTELTYAVFPKSAGTLTIAPLQYTGSMRRQQLVVARTEPVTIEIVDPASDPEAGRLRPWLPADAVALASEWSADVTALKVGEPITRTIQIATAGQRAAAIAPLELPDGPYKQYSEQPLLEDIETSTGILGRRTDAIVLVPTQEGEITLPAIEIDWWNIGEERWQVARLAAETLQVVAGPAASPAQPPTLMAPESGPLPAVPQSGTLPLDRITLALAGLSTVLLVLCIALWIRVRRLESASIAGSPLPGDDAFARSGKEKDAFNLMLRTLTKRNPVEARREILAWARAHFAESRVTRLEQIAENSSDPVLENTLAALDAQLYREESDVNGDESDPVDYDDLKHRLSTLRAASLRGDPKTRATLDKLYPDRSDA